MSLRRDCHDHVERTAGEVGELQLNHRTLALPRRADRSTDESLLRDRRVDHAIRAELFVQPGGDTEGAAVAADVLAEQEDALVAAHRVGETVANRVEIGIGAQPRSLTAVSAAIRASASRSAAW